jgi:hypothetical protein
MLYGKKKIHIHDTKKILADTLGNLENNWNSCFGKSSTARTELRQYPEFEPGDLSLM